MRAGQLTEKITLQEATISTNSYGANDLVWNDVLTTRANVIYQNGNRINDTNEITFAYTVTFVIRSYHKINERMRILYNDKLYRILSIEDTFVFCILLLNRLHRGDTFRNRLTMLRDASQSRFHLRSRYSQSFVIRRHSRSFAVNLLSLEEFCCQTKRSVRALLCCFKKYPV